MLRGGIFTVKIPTFSGKTAENVMGVYGIDCPAIFWDRECTTFWGGGRGCAGALTRPSTRHLPPKNFEKTALRKRGGIFTVKMRGGHNYGNYCTWQVQIRLNSTDTLQVGSVAKGSRIPLWE